MNSKNLIKIEKLYKSYGSVAVLKGVTLQVKAGQIFGIIGENGAGKSTLVKTILGITNPDSGTIERNCRCAAIHQEQNLAKDLTVVENIFLGQELKTPWGTVNQKAMVKETLKLFKMLNVELDPKKIVGELSIAQRQMVEVAKALSVNGDLLIMDEPTTLLNREETELLFSLMRQLQAQGCGIIYISHKLAEVQEICDDIMILRDGEVVSQTPAHVISTQEMAQKMVGRELSRLFPEKRTISTNAPVILRVENLHAFMVNGVSFELKQGEILGIGGLGGSGRSQLAEALMALSPSTGKIELLGAEVKFKSPQEAMANGICYLSEDRQESGILTEFSIEENITLSALKKYCRNGVINSQKVRHSAENYIKKFKIKAPSSQELLRNLSGGNQQKVAIAKELDANPKVFIFDEPTRGVDVAARHDIYEFIDNLAQEGIGCIMICSDLEELIGMANRVMVMREGAVAGFVEAERLSEEEIMYLATGVCKE